MKSIEFRQPESEPENENIEVTKSSTLENIVGLAALAAVAVSPQAQAQENVSAPAEEVVPEVAQIPETRPTTRERVTNQERERLGERFSLEQYTYNTLYARLTNREVMFTDEQGIIIGEPVRLDPIVETQGDGRVVVTTPGQLDTRGVPVANISPAWLNLTRSRMCREYNVPCNLAESKPRVRSTIRLVRDSERYLTPSAARPETFLDIIESMGGKQVPGAVEGTSYIEYTQTHFGENVEMPAAIETELQRLLPGLIAQESQFNDLARSPVGARGMLQIMPDTQRRMGYGTEQLSFQRQIELSGQYFEDAHTELTTRNEDDFNYIKDEFFAGDQAAFEQYFLTPVLINSYNAGVTRLSRVVSWFRSQYPTRASIQTITKGEDNLRYDVFAAMAHLASENTTPETRGYKEHSSEYFSRVFSLAEAIQGLDSSPNISVTDN